MSRLETDTLEETTPLDTIFYLVAFMAMLTILVSFLDREPQQDKLLRCTDFFSEDCPHP